MPVQNKGPAKDQSQNLTNFNQHGTQRFDVIIERREYKGECNQQQTRR